MQLELEVKLLVFCLISYVCASIKINTPIYQAFPMARHCSKQHPFVISFNPFNNPIKWILLSTIAFYRVETEAERVTYLSTHSKWWSQDLNPYFDTIGHTCTGHNITLLNTHRLLPADHAPWRILRNGGGRAS